jgi:hypothetical protein
MYFNFSNLLEENRIVTYLVTKKWALHKQWCQISWSGSKFHYLTITVLYNCCTGIYKFGNNIYPRHIRRRSNLGHIFRGKKCILWAGKYAIHTVTWHCIPKGSNLYLLNSLSSLIFSCCTALRTHLLFGVIAVCF